MVQLGGEDAAREYEFVFPDTSLVSSLLAAYQ